MTINEAIKIQTSLLVDRQDLSGTALAEAIQLGIEALKKLLKQRQYNIPSSAFPLPGETEGG